MVRMAKKRHHLLKYGHLHLEDKKLMKSISHKTQKLSDHAESLYLKTIETLKTHKIHIIKHNEALEEENLKRCKELYFNLIEPIITPILIAKNHPFPYISHLDTHIAVLIGEQREHEEKQRYILIKLPHGIEPYRILKEEKPLTIISTLQTVLLNLDNLFPSVKILDFFVFRITRDMENSDPGKERLVAENILQNLELQLVERKFGDVVRIQTSKTSADNNFIELLKKKSGELYMNFNSSVDSIELSFLNKLYSMLRVSSLKYKIFTPSNLYFTKSIEDYSSIFDLIAAKDVMVHHPYESFVSSTLEFLKAAVNDPDVVSIKQTIYRTDSNAVLIDLLSEAASSGKHVIVVVEVHARFDENANLRWAKQLEHAGCHVIYGMQNLKVHFKAILIVRKSLGKLLRYAHVSTGNYNADTAKLYEDIGLFTFDPRITLELDELFRVICSGGYSETRDFEHILVSPFNMRKELNRKIDTAISTIKNGEKAEIYIKVNTITDEELIDKIYEAAKIGVKFYLIVRGACSLADNENIKIISIIGRFLEHSRIYSFSYGDEHECYIGSADIMYRNLNKRVEVMAPIYSNNLKERVRFLLKKMCSEESTFWYMKENKWHIKKSSYNMQDYLLSRRGLLQ
jgi:polyphosphate kinase